MSVGVIAADMQHDWASAGAVRELAGALAASRAKAPRPVVVTRTRVRHVTPEPLVVRKKVYRTMPGQGAAGSQGSSSGGTASGSGSGGSRRTVVAPAPAPARSQAQAPSATTSKTSQRPSWEPMSSNCSS